MERVLVPMITFTSINNNLQIKITESTFNLANNISKQCLPICGNVFDGGRDNVMDISAIDIFTSIIPRGGNGTSPQKFDIYFSIGTGALEILIRYNCIKNCRNCHKNGYFDTTHKPFLL